MILECTKYIFGIVYIILFILMTYEKYYVYTSSAKIS